MLEVLRDLLVIQKHCLAEFQFLEMLLTSCWVDLDLMICIIFCHNIRKHRREVQVHNLCPVYVFHVNV